LIINQLEPHDQGSLRLVAAAVKEQTDKVLESVQASRVDIEKLTALVKNLKALKQLTVSATG
jgi:predicted AAA+ superfamily ATPase